MFSWTELSHPLCNTINSHCGDHVQSKCLWLHHLICCKGSVGGFLYLLCHPMRTLQTNHVCLYQEVVERNSLIQHLTRFFSFWSFFFYSCLSFFFFFFRKLSFTFVIHSLSVNLYPSIPTTNYHLFFLSLLPELTSPFVP